MEKYRENKKEIFKYYTTFNIIVNDMGSHRVHTFYVPRPCSIVA